MIIDKTYLSLKFTTLQLPRWSFAIKRKKKDTICISSYYLVNSSIIYNLEIMINMPFTITLILTAIINIVFNFFSKNVLNAKSNAAVYEGHKNFKKAVTNSSQFAE